MGRWADLSDSIRIATIALAIAGATGAAACDTPAGRLVAAEGVVEVRAQAATVWAAVKPGHILCGSDQVAVRGDGRAAVVLSNDVLVRLDRNTTLTLTEVATDRDSRLGLVEGIVHVISRFRKRFGVSTPFVNALVEGTEFTVTSDATKARVSVDEGRVRTVNEYGEHLLGVGEAAEAGAGAAPHGIVVRPLDAIAWAIHYPQIIWIDDVELARMDDLPAAAVRQTRAAAAAGRYADALSAIATTETGPGAPRLAALRASLLLALGRPEEASDAIGRLPRDADAAALEAIVAVASNQNDAALLAAQRAVATDAGSAAAQLALGYALQARRQLNEALVAAVRATELTPANPVAWARRAELELSLSQLPAGRASAGRALELAPAMPHAQAMLGIAQLLSRDGAAALGTLEAAVAADPADPLAHFGLGLVHVRNDDIERGRREVEIAVLLDPTNAELRSYLGRAYLEEKRSRAAAAEFDLARRLDPASPTPWYFDALRKLRDNDPLGAIDDGLKAIALNDNRAVLRGTELVEQDRATRAISLGEAYREVGFDQPMRAAAMAALADDPQSSAAHRLLADAYAETPRFETARVSEMLQAQLRQPIGQWPVPPQFVLPLLPVLQGSRALSQDESSMLFDTKPYRFAASLVAGDQGTRGNSLLAARSWERGQISVGEFKYRSDGFRDGAAVDLSGQRVEAQLAPAAGTTVFAEWRRSRRIGGDVTQRLLETSREPTVHQDVTTDLGRLGFRYEPSVSEEIVGAYSSVRRKSRQANLTVLDPALGLSLAQDSSNVEDGRDMSLQYVRQIHRSSLIAGISHFRQTGDGVINSSICCAPALDFPPDATTRGGSHDSAYLYLLSRLNDYWTLHTGLSRHRFDEDQVNATSRYYGKLGVSAEPQPGTRVRLAVFQGIKGLVNEEQVIEPTQFNGFNQLFDDYDGTRWTRKALSIDHQFGSRVQGGVEWSERKLRVPNLGCGADCTADWRDRMNRIYMTWSPTGNVAVGAQWTYDATLLDSAIDPSFTTVQATAVRTTTLPLTLWVRAAANLSLRAEAIRVRQTADFVNNPGAASATEAFTVANLRISYRQSHSPWSLEGRVHNMFDRRFRFQNTDLNGQPRVPLFYPLRTIVLQASLRF